MLLTFFSQPACYKGERARYCAEAPNSPGHSPHTGKRRKVDGEGAILCSPLNSDVLSFFYLLCSPCGEILPLYSLDSEVVFHFQVCKHKQSHKKEMVILFPMNQG